LHLAPARAQARRVPMSAERKRLLARWRQQRHRERQQLVAVTSHDVMPVTTEVTAPASPCNRLSAVTSGVAGTLFGTAVSANAVYAWSLGASDLASSIFAGIGVAADALVFVLPTIAAAQWRSGRKVRSLVGWAIYVPAIAFAVSGSIGFSAVNIADVTAVRAARSSPAVELAQRRLDIATAQSATECKRVGPLCRARQGEARQALVELDAAQRAVQAAADPQVAKTAQLVSWITPWHPGADDLAMVRLVLLTLLPQLGGLVLMVGRR
jgi:hypothetical protein